MSTQDQISDEESLRSKYVRLGTEFKKLRERYRAMKDGFKESTERIAYLESKITDQTIHMRNLEHEKESLMFRNQYLIKQAAFLEKQLETTNQKHSRPVANGYSVDSQSYDDALKNALAEVHNLHEELVAQSSQFLTRIAELESTISPSPKPQNVSVTVQTSPLPNLSPFTQSSSSVDATSSSYDVLCSQEAERDLLQMANNPSSALSPPPSVRNETLRSPPTQGLNGSISVDKTPQSTQMSPRTHSLPLCVSDSADSKNQLSPRENVLLERVSQLESQLAEITLKQRVETRRTQLSKLATTNADSNAFLSSPIDIGLSAKEKLLVEYYEGQLHDRTKQLILYAGRVADAYSEIRSLHEHLRCARNESERQRRKTSAAEARANSLEEELESTKHQAAQQLTEMAQHLANLTDDLHALQGSGGANTTNASACNASKNSFFSSLLKRSNQAADFFTSTHRENSTPTRKDSRIHYSLE
ncbi:hypothetical protein Aperf_G00000033962 [Anoplocephala perfoliata]